MKAYRFNHFDLRIEEVEIERFTRHFVILKTKSFRGKNQRDARDSGWSSYYETPEEAIEGIKENFIKEIEQTKAGIRRAQERKERLEARYERFLVNIET